MPSHKTHIHFRAGLGLNASSSSMFSFPTVFFVFFLPVVLFAGTVALFLAGILIAAEILDFDLSIIAKAYSWKCHIQTRGLRPHRPRRRPPHRYKIELSFEIFFEILVQTRQEDQEE